MKRKWARVFSPVSALVCWSTVLSVMVAGCMQQPDADREATSLSGALSIVPADRKMSGSTAPSVEVVSEQEVRILYLVGSCGGVQAAPDMPRSVDVEYTPSEVRLLVDGSVRCGGDTESVGVVREAVVVLAEPLAGRGISIAQER